MAAVAVRNSTSNINASNASTIVNFTTPATPTSGDVWYCTAIFRGGSAATISGVPGSFTLIKRTDSGSGSTNVVLVTYAYVATGSESGTFASITISGSSKYTTLVEACSNALATAPFISGSVISAVGTSGSVSTTPTTINPGLDQMVLAFAGQQGAVASPVPDDQGSLSSPSAQNTTSGGSAATNVGGAASYLTYATSSVPETWNMGVATSTEALHVFVVDVAASGPTVIDPNVPVTGMRAAVARSTVY